MYPTPNTHADATAMTNESPAGPNSASAAPTVARHIAATRVLPQRCASAPVASAVRPQAPINT